jgi:DNA-binding MarR family transcriptional regulator
VLLLVEKLNESAFPAEIPGWILPRPATISGLLDRMEDGWLVRRASNPDNEKAKQMAMTRKGEGGSGASPGRRPLCTAAT